jgi:hypothetical protein
MLKSFLMVKVSNLEAPCPTSVGHPPKGGLIHSVKKAHFKDRGLTPL